MAKLSKNALLGQILSSIQACGWTPLVLEENHPFVIRLASLGQPSFEVRIYIWNCTPGGKNRAADEFRIQVTSAVPQIDPARRTLLLGWHDELEVFAAWNMKVHHNQSSTSPSLQVKLGTLESARRRAFATQRKDNEIVVAFQPEFFVDYALSKDSFHQTGPGRNDIELLDDLESVTDADIDGISSPKRRSIVRTIVTKYRAANFRRNVLKAYEHRCAFCGVQLSLLDAAHIIPVSAPASTDDVTNGVALCKQHHFAFDSNLVSFNERYQIEISATKIKKLTSLNLHGGIGDFRKGILTSLLLPQYARHYPSRRYIKVARSIRGWKP